jgi:transposase
VYGIIGLPFHGAASSAAALGKKVLVLIWDNAPWRVSQEVRGFIRRYNREGKRRGESLRRVVCYLPIKSPWLNPIEPKWVQGKRRVLEAERLLTGKELAQRVCKSFDCTCEAHLSIAEKVT